MNPTLRPARPEDGPALAALIEASIRALAPRAYSPMQVAAWLRRAAERAPFDARDGEGRVRILAEFPGRDDPAGLAELEPDGRVDLLFAAPWAVGRGVGDALCAALVGAACALGLPSMRVEASELARPVFARAGFETVRRRDFDLGGVSIWNHEMVRRFGGVDG